MKNYILFRDYETFKLYSVLYRFLLPLAIVLVLGGCATAKQFEITLNEWIGKHADELVEAWGPPARQYTFSDGRRVIEYNNERLISYDEPSLPTIIGHDEDGNPIYSTFFSRPQTLHRYCRTIIYLDVAGIISKWRSQGNDCIYRIPKINNDGNIN